mmetsp:Transcript_29286/g.89693  ORF Transcript_29286/g.89693 Transcript_29286/m.89693 type:complete len:214 (+) Transcript_29286:1085-1726(+)
MTMSPLVPGLNAPMTLVCSRPTSAPRRAVKRGSKGCDCFAGAAAAPRARFDGFPRPEPKLALLAGASAGATPASMPPLFKAASGIIGVLPCVFCCRLRDDFGASFLVGLAPIALTSRCTVASGMGIWAESMIGETSGLTSRQYEPWASKWGRSRQLSGSLLRYGKHIHLASLFGGIGDFHACTVAGMSVSRERAFHSEGSTCKSAHCCILARN